jgi:opacity protein-like surface antigen
LSGACSCRRTGVHFAGTCASAALYLLACSSLLAFSTSTFAADLRLPPPAYVPPAGFFIGLGGSYNSVKFDQDIYALGLSNVFNGATLVANGIAQGPGDPFHSLQSTFAPEAQAGYFRYFNDSGWLWGAKLKYKYLGTTATQQGLIVGQTGSSTPTGGGAPTPLTGNVLIQSTQTSIEHELSALAFLGHSYTNGMVYLGAGPALFKTKSTINRAVGFGDVNGVPTAITGAPESFASSTWMWGAAAQIGMTYTFAPSWFLDFNYTYTATKKYDINYSAPFTSTSAGLTYVGTAYITTPQRITTQAFAVSINKLF